MSEVRSQMSEVRCQRPEARGQERGQSVEIMILPAYSIQLIAYDGLRCKKTEVRSQNERSQSVEIMILPAYGLQLIAYDWSEGRGQKSE